jgi:hypothetical protein
MWNATFDLYIYIVILSEVPVSVEIPVSVSILAYREQHVWHVDWTDHIPYDY